MFELLLNPFGRIGRGMWWSITVVQLTLSLCWLSYNGWDFHHPLEFPDMTLVANVVAYSITWLWWCACIKRFHDRGKSSFWLLAFIMPFVGLVWILVELGIRPGDRSENRFGPPPGTPRRAGYDKSDEDDETWKKLEKFDDDYFKNYALQKATASVPIQSAPPARVRAITSSAPVFGKRT
jgi:uncharacterized membrane protein YhaH (DUF805 family)